MDQLHEAGGSLDSSASASSVWAFCVNGSGVPLGEVLHYVIKPRVCAIMASVQSPDTCLNYSGGSALVGGYRRNIAGNENGQHDIYRSAREAAGCACLNRIAFSDSNPGFRVISIAGQQVCYGECLEIGTHRFLGKPFLQRRFPQKIRSDVLLSEPTQELPPPSLFDVSSPQPVQSFIQHAFKQVRLWVEGQPAGFPLGIQSPGTFQ